MPRFAANVSMLFTEYPFLERFGRAAAVGFRGVELLFPYEEDVPAIAAALKQHGLTQALFNLPAGNFAGGERGYANDPRRQAEFRDGVARALEIATTIGAEKVNCLVGFALPDVAPEVQWGTMIESLRYAAEQAQQAGVRQVFEPLNPFDAPGFMVHTTAQALRVLDAVGHPNLSIQWDVYHMQRTEGNLTDTIRQQIGRIGHVQIADSPARNEPGRGEINYPFVLKTFDDAGYTGWVSLEYRPAGDTEAGLSWLRTMGFWQ